MKLLSSTRINGQKFWHDVLTQQSASERNRLYDHICDRILCLKPLVSTLLAALDMLSVYEMFFACLFKPFYAE